MTLLVITASGWGYTNGGINVFNREMCKGMSAFVSDQLRVLCVAPDIPQEEIDRVRENEKIALLSVSVDEFKVPEVIVNRVKDYCEREKLVNPSVIWLGHDTYSDKPALECRDRWEGSKCAIIHHMAYGTYYPLMNLDTKKSEEKEKVQRERLSSADIVFANGPLLKQSAQDLCGKKDNVYEILPGVFEVNSIKKDAANFFNIVSFGRIEQKSGKKRSNSIIKQIFLAVASWAEFTSRLKPSDNSAMKVYGKNENDPDDTFYEQIKAYARSVYPFSVIPYETDHNKLLEELSNYSLCLILSTKEGFGLTALEAISAGVPVVISESSGFYLALKEKLLNGFLYHLPIEGSLDEPYYSANDLANVAGIIKEVFDDKNNAKKKTLKLREELIKAGFTWENCARTILSELGTLRNDEVVKGHTNKLAREYFTMDHPIKFFGREEKLQEVLGYIGKQKIILVKGEGGIGKTEFCKEILKRAIKISMLCTGVNLIECRTFDDMIKRIAEQFGIMVDNNESAELIEEAILLRLKGVLYLDNFEDIISEKYTTAENRKKAIQFLRKCNSLDGLTVLISSRSSLDTDFIIKRVDLDVLDEENAVKLFTWLWTQGESVSGNEDIRMFVVNKLYRYPLSIVLAANHKDYVSTIEGLEQKWETHRREVHNQGMENGRHESLETAFNMTYTEIKDDTGKRALWELFTLFPNEIEESAARYIIDDYDDVLKKLIKLGVVHISEKNKSFQTASNKRMYLSIQPTLKEYIMEVGEYPGDIKAIATKLLGYYSRVYSSNGDREWGTENDLYAGGCLTDALYLMNWFIEQKDVNGVKELHKCIYLYYQDAPYEAVTVLEKAVELRGLNDKFKADLLRYCANIEARTDQAKKATEHYNEAERICREVKYNLGLANVLKARGDLEMRTKQLEKAGECFAEAEKLYCQSKSVLGLANVLKAEGDLEIRKGQLNKAKKKKKENKEEVFYKKSEILYRQAKQDLGLANLLLAMGDNELRNRRLRKAEKHYSEAEEIYTRIKDDLGLANVLLSTGKLLQRKTKKDFEAALEKCESAYEYFRKKKEKTGQCYSAAEICYCYYKVGDNTHANEYADITKRLCKELPYKDVENYCKRKLSRIDLW